MVDGLPIYSPQKPVLLSLFINQTSALYFED